MRKFVTILSSLLFISPALAQHATSDRLAQNTAQSPTSNQMDRNSQAQDVSPDTARITDKIKSHLEQVGFQNVKLMPGSFIVRAEDQNHNPVMMVINPDSVTAIQAMDLGPDKSDQTTGGQATGSSRGPDQASQNCR